MKLWNYLKGVVPIILAFFASLCCTVPVILAALGITATGLSVLTRFHSWFLGGAIGSILLFVASFIYRATKRKVSKIEIILAPLVVMITLYLLLQGHNH